MILSIAFFAIIVLLSAALYHSVKRNLELIELLEDVSKSLDDSLEELKFYHKRIDKKLKLELLSDDPIVKELVEDMKQARRTVGTVYEKLTNEKYEIVLDDEDDQESQR